jgi:hypothetical protein
LSTIDDQIIDYQTRLDRLLALYLNGEFAKEVLIEQKSRSGEMLTNLGNE